MLSELIFLYITLPLSWLFVPATVAKANSSSVLEKDILFSIFN